MDIEFTSPVKTLSFDEGIVAPKVVSEKGAGLLVVLRPKGAETDMLGVSLGEMNVAMGWRQDGEAVMVTAHMAQPAIFVPVLRQIVYGHECKWRVIASHDDLSGVDGLDVEPWIAMATLQIARGLPSGEDATSEKPTDLQAAE